MISTRAKTFRELENRCENYEKRLEALQRKLDALERDMLATKTKAGKRRFFSRHIFPIIQAIMKTLTVAKFCNEVYYRTTGRRILNNVRRLMHK